MKNLSINLRIAAIAMISFLTVAFTNTASATEGNPSAVELKFIGNVKNKPVFQLTYTGAASSEFTIVVRDEYNTILYRDVVKGSNIAKNYMLNTDELGDTGVTFEVSGKKTEKPVVFEISKSTRFVQDLVINKVK